jgi:hypothetical protein
MSVPLFFQPYEMNIPMDQASTGKPATVPQSVKTAWEETGYTGTIPDKVGNRSARRVQAWVVSG